jgi:PAS domain S-box-containing protein
MYRDGQSTSGEAGLATFAPDGRLERADSTFVRLIAEPVERWARLDQLLATVGVAQAAMVAPAGSWRIDGGGDQPLVLVWAPLGEGRKVATLASVPTTSGSLSATGLSDTRFLQEVIDLIPATISVKDRFKRYVLVNQSWLAYAGVTRDQVIGRTYAEVPVRDLDLDTKEPHYGQVMSRDEAVLASGQPLMNQEEVMVTVDGRKLTRLSHKLPFHDAHGRAIGLLSVTFDITDRIEILEQLSDAKQRADEASRAKSRFLAHMSHELRTPLNAVIGFADAIEQQVFGTIGHVRYLDYARDIRASGQHLLGMIDTILDLTNLESGSFDLRETAFGLGDLVEECCERVDGQAAAGGVELMQAAEFAEVTIRADREALRQVLLNLLSNAIKFSPSGARVVVGLEQIDSGDLMVTVTDRGPGISEEVLLTIFEPFRRINAESRDVLRGRGVGLAISRLLAERHGGRLLLDSTVGHGTRAVLALPRDRVTLAPDLR